MERKGRVRALVAVVVLSAALLAGQAATASGPAASAQTANGTYPGDTLIGVQGYGDFSANNGKALIVNQQGEVVWEWSPPNSRVFDVEALDDGNVLASVAEYRPASRCPDRFTGPGGYGDECVRNRVVEIDPSTDEVVWQYDWYDAFIHWHEVHDADRLPNGETAIVDMGNNRAFTVNRQGEITWQWNASEHIGEGTDFWNQYVPEDQQSEFRRKGPESDWTHMNDIDRLDNGNFQLSIRNFDVVVEVDPQTNDIVSVVGRPGDHQILNEQHNPDRLERHGTVLVADSENDRVVEIDAKTNEIVWRYDGSGANGLRWPRDADRLPNGNTLVTDSLHFRVLEVDRDGQVVWSYSLADKRGIVYEADRMSLPEEPQNVPSGRTLVSDRGRGPVAQWSAFVERFLGLVFPLWFGVPELLTALVGLVGVVGLAVEWVRAR
ncbi:MAG: aryl-sulfate sulfotransferase [Haloarculaceae archaeon]